MRIYKWQCARIKYTLSRSTLSCNRAHTLMQKGGQRDLFGRADLAMTTNYQVLLLLFPNFIPLSGVKSALYGGYAREGASHRATRDGTRSKVPSERLRAMGLCTR
jgi:hypothetical protein